MALTASEEALVRQLLDRQAAILSLAGNEATITSKLGAKKVTLADLVAASALADADLLLTRQGATDKSVRADILAAYMASELNLSKFATQQQLTNYATLQQLTNYATLQQLTNYATLQQLTNYAPLLNPLFTKQNSNQHGGKIRLQAADNQLFGDIIIDHFDAQGHIRFFTQNRTGGAYLNLSRISPNEWVELLPPSGSILITAANSQPEGYLRANGAAVSRTAYANLFASIGTIYGAGDGNSTFNLPDLRGEFIRGWDNGRGVDAGRAIGSWQNDEIKSHTHGIPISSTTGAGANPIGGPNLVATNNTQATGGNETRPRNVALLTCIKY